MFNVYIQQKGSDALPTDDICYIITKNGVLLKKKIGFIDSLVPVDKISILGDLTPYAKMNIPKIKTKEIAQVLNFFKDVYKEYRSEANIIVHYNPKTKKYIMQVPQQKVSGGSVHYLNNVQYPGYNRVGTIHSHSSMGAFHSGTDDQDESEWDGFHFTIGNLDKKYVSISASIDINGKRFEVPCEDYIEGIKYFKEPEVKPVSQIGNMIDIYTPSYRGDYEYAHTSESGYYVENGESYSYPKTWMDFIDKQTYKNHYELIRVLKTDLSVVSTSQLKKFSDVIDTYEKSKVTKVEDFNPCEECPFRELKVDLMLSEQEQEQDDKEDMFVDDPNDLFNSGKDFKDGV